MHRLTKQRLAAFGWLGRLLGRKRGEQQARNRRVAVIIAKVAVWIATCVRLRRLYTLYGRATAAHPRLVSNEDVLHRDLKQPLASRREHVVHLLQAAAVEELSTGH